MLTLKRCLVHDFVNLLAFFSVMVIGPLELIDRRKWIDREAFTLSFGLARLTPGTKLLSCAAGIGWLLRGFPGAIGTLLAGSIPCSLVVLIVTARYESWSKNPFVIIELGGALAAAVGVMVATCWTRIRPHWSSISLLRLVLFSGSALALGLFGIPPIRVLFLAAIAGLLRPQGEKA
jgi:chromate transporter